MKTNRTLLCLTGLLLASSTLSRAVVVIDNLAVGTQSFSESLSGPTATGFFGGSFADREVAFSFTTGTSNVRLTELVFAVAIGNSNLDPIQLTLSTGSSAPGGTNPITIGMVAPPSSSPTSQLLTVTPTVPPVLLANTLYWIHFTVPSGGPIYTIANTNTPTVDPEWTLGTTWRRSPLSPWSELDSGPVARIKMSVVVIPEPVAPLMGALGTILLLRRRRD